MYFLGELALGQVCDGIHRTLRVWCAPAAHQPAPSISTTFAQVRKQEFNVTASAEQMIAAYRATGPDTASPLSITRRASSSDTSVPKLRTDIKTLIRIRARTPMAKKRERQRTEHWQQRTENRIHRSSQVFIRGFVYSTTLRNAINICH